MQQRWLVTGGSRGLGRALSEAVLEAGHRLVATARDPQQLTDLAERYGDAVRTVALDVTDPLRPKRPFGSPSIPLAVSIPS
jgi:NAD(P)-dependent dehydrogenase (short-subunit alcohol dehydrogenase family)